MSSGFLSRWLAPLGLSGSARSVTPLRAWSETDYIVVPKSLDLKTLKFLRHRLVGSERLHGVVPSAVSACEDRALGDSTELFQDCAGRIAAELIGHAVLRENFLLELIGRSWIVRHSHARGGGHQLIESVGQASIRSSADALICICLSDACDYAGGELVLHDASGVKLVSLDAGDAVLLHAEGAHAIAPVISGEWIGALCWTRSRLLAGQAPARPDRHIERRPPIAVEGQHGRRFGRRGLQPIHGFAEG